MVINIEPSRYRTHPKQGEYFLEKRGEFFHKGSEKAIQVRIEVLKGKIFTHNLLKPHPIPVVSSTLYFNTQIKTLAAF